MLSFTSNLNPRSEAFAIFITEKYTYKNKDNTLPNSTIQKINSFLKVLKTRNKEEEISSFDISDQQKCFIIKVKNKYDNYYPEEIGGSFISYLKKLKSIYAVDLCVDSLNQDRDKLVKFFSKFIFGFNLKSYTFNKYKTLNKEKINKKINLKIITSYKQKIENSYKYYDASK